MLTITDSITSFSISKEEAIDLERKLNVTRYRKIWAAIGDSLFAFGTNRYKGDVLMITTPQLEFIEILRTRPSWKNCYDL